MANHYDPGMRCPSCHGRQWLIGAVTAECVHCGTATMLTAGSHPATIMARGRGGRWTPGHYAAPVAIIPTVPPSSIMARSGAGNWRSGRFAA